MIWQLRNLENNIRIFKGKTDNMIKQCQEIEDMIKNIRGIDYYITAYFERTEHYCWVIDVILSLHLLDGCKESIIIYTCSLCGSKSPQEVNKRLNELDKEYNTHKVIFNPTIWEFKMDTKYDGRLSYWEKRK